MSTKMLGALKAVRAAYIGARGGPWATVDAAIAAAEAAAPLPAPDVTWLWTHCRANGMTRKSDSKSFRDDVALFVCDLRARIAELEAAPTLHNADSGAWVSDEAGIAFSDRVANTFLCINGPASENVMDSLRLASAHEFGNSSVLTPPPAPAAHAAHLLQDTDKGLSQWLERDPNARQHARDAAEGIAGRERAQDAARWRLLLDGPHNFGVFVCSKDGSPDDSISNAELTAALDGLMSATPKPTLKPSAPVTSGFVQVIDGPQQHSTLLWDATPQPASPTAEATAAPEGGA